MTPEDLDIITARVSANLEEVVAKSIELNVNGKIRSMREVVDEIKDMNLVQNEKIDKHAQVMKDVQPILEAWKKAEQVEAGLGLIKNITTKIVGGIGGMVIFLGAVVGAYITITKN